MRAGRLRQRVTIQQVTEVQNSYGEPAKNWAAAVETTVWGEMAPLMSRAREMFAERVGQMQAVAPYQCRLRYREDISTVTTRLKWEGRTFHVEAALDPDGRQRETIVLCYEVQA